MFKRAKNTGRNAVTQNVIPLCETLESRQLFSASVGTIKTEVNTLATDSSTLKADVKALETRLLQAIGAGTGGRAALDTDLLKLKSDISSANALLTDDLNTVKADRTSGLAAAVATLNTDAHTEAALLKADFTAIESVLEKHPQFLSAHVKLAQDQAAVETIFAAVKADGKALVASTNA